MTLDRFCPGYRVFPDYGADPVWDAGGMVDVDTLPITQDLRDRLRAWNDEWEALSGVAEGRYEIVDHGAHRVWQARGHALVKQLQVELGESCLVLLGPSITDA